MSKGTHGYVHHAIRPLGYCTREDEDDVLKEFKRTSTTLTTFACRHVISAISLNFDLKNSLRHLHAQNPSRGRNKKEVIIRSGKLCKILKLQAYTNMHNVHAVAACGRWVSRIVQHVKCELFTFFNSKLFMRTFMHIFYAFCIALNPRIMCMQILGSVCITLSSMTFKPTPLPTMSPSNTPLCSSNSRLQCRLTFDFRFQNESSIPNEWTLSLDHERNATQRANENDQ